MSLLLAHGLDPQALAPSLLFGNWVLAIVALTLAGGLAWVNLKPVFDTRDEKQRRELAGWTAVGLAVLVGMGTWVTRQSVTEAVTQQPDLRSHVHSMGHGGQMAMWGDYHAELGRVISGEYRLWLTDSFQRPIGNRFFRGSLVPRDPKTGICDEAGAVTLEAGLDELYRLAVLPRSVKSVQVRMEYPGGRIKLNFVFDGTRGKRTMPAWCGT